MKKFDEKAMSALGQKKQACAAHKPMSAKCQKRTFGASALEAYNVDL